MNTLFSRIHKMGYKKLLFYSMLLISFVTSVWFVDHNESFYHRPIAEVTEARTVHTENIVDSHRNEDRLITQQITAKLKNGEAKGQLVVLTNKYAGSKLYNQEVDVGDKLIVALHENPGKEGQWKGTIQDVKRDQQVVWIAWIFIFVLLLVGRKQGLLSIISLVVNVLLISLAIDLYLHTEKVSLLLICGFSGLLFTFISLLLVSGRNEKTYAAIAATLLGTILMLLITSLFMWATSEKGLRFEEMPFLTRAPEVVFMAGVLVGALGAVMDVAITMCASLFALYEKNSRITAAELRASGMEIGKDIMGTMTNILFFVYISGSIPMLLLYLRNDSQWGYALSMNVSLELARALAGGIGIVLTIPISLYLCIWFIHRKRVKG